MDFFSSNLDFQNVSHNEYVSGMKIPTFRGLPPPPDRIPKLLLIEQKSSRSLKYILHCLKPDENTL